MPTLRLYTNVPVDSVTSSDILRDATKAVAKIIGKPESVKYRYHSSSPCIKTLLLSNAHNLFDDISLTYVMIVLNGSVPIAFAGTEAPAAYGELISIGGLGPTVNGKLSSTIAEILQTKLSVDSNRFYIKFYDVERSFFGFNGSTF